MTTVIDRKAAASKLTTCASGGALVMLGIIHFLLTTSGKPDAALPWTWALVAMGFSVILGGLMIGRKSRLVRVLLGIGIAVLVVSIFLVKISQVATV